MAFSSLPAPGAPAPVSQERPPVKSQPHGQKTYEARDQIYSSFYRLPDTFTRNDVCKVLGYEPDRGTLFRILRDMVREGYIRVEDRGAGQRATIYAKNDAAEVPSQE